MTGTQELARSTASPSAALAVVCDREGRVIECLRDDVGCAREVAPGRRFQGVSADYLGTCALVDAVRARGVATARTLYLVTRGGSLRALEFVGRRVGDLQLLVGAEKAEAALALLDTLARASRPRKATAPVRPVRATRDVSSRFDGAIDDVVRLQRELLATRGELTRRTVELRRARRELERGQAELSRLGVRDPVTGLYQRGELGRMVGDEIARSREEGSPFTVALVELESAGPPVEVGAERERAEAMCAAAVALRRGLRVGDLAARYGREELALVLPGARSTDRAVVVGRVRELVERGAAAGGRALRVTIGVASFPEQGATAAELLATAERSLLEALQCDDVDVVLDEAVSDDDAPYAELVVGVVDDDAVPARRAS